MTPSPASGPGGLADGRKRNASAGTPTAARQAEAVDAHRAEPPDGGLWSGPELARYVRDRWGVEVCPATGRRWVEKGATT